MANLILPVEASKDYQARPIVSEAQLRSRAAKSGVESYGTVVEGPEQGIERGSDCGDCIKKGSCENDDEKGEESEIIINFTMEEVEKAAPQSDIGS